MKLQRKELKKSQMGKGISDFKKNNNRRKGGAVALVSDVTAPQKNRDTYTFERSIPNSG